MYQYHQCIYEYITLGREWERSITKVVLNSEYNYNQLHRSLLIQAYDVNFQIYAIDAPPVSSSPFYLWRGRAWCGASSRHGATAPWSGMQRRRKDGFCSQSLKNAPNHSKNEWLEPSNHDFGRCISFEKVGWLSGSMDPRNLQQDLLNGPRKNLNIYIITLATYLGVRW